MGQLSSATSFPGLPSRATEDHASVAELLCLFSEELSPLMRTLRETVVQVDLKPIETAPPTLATLSISQVQSSAAVLEQPGRRSQSEGLAAALTALRQDSEEVAASLRLYLEESPVWKF